MIDRAHIRFVSKRKSAVGKITKTRSSSLVSNFATIKSNNSSNWGSRNSYLYRRYKNLYLTDSGIRLFSMTKSRHSSFKPSSFVFPHLKTWNGETNQCSKHGVFGVWLLQVSVTFTKDSTKFDALTCDSNIGRDCSFSRLKYLPS